MHGPGAQYVLLVAVSIGLAAMPACSGGSNTSTDSAADHASTETGGRESRPDAGASDTDGAPADGAAPDVVSDALADVGTGAADASDAGEPGGEDAGSDAAVPPGPAARWFVYLANEEQGTSPSVRTRLYAIELGAVGLPRVTLGPADAGERAVQSFRASPDRRRVAYNLNDAAGDQGGLYLVDFSGAQPSPAAPVDESGAITELAWSNDGARLAYVRRAAGALQVVVADVAGSSASAPVVVDSAVGDAGVSVLWINPDVLAYQPLTAEAPLRYVILTAAGPRPPATLQTAGAWYAGFSGARTRATPPAAALEIGTCAGSAFADFDRALLLTFPTRMLHAADLSWAAGLGADGTWSIRRGGASSSAAPVASLLGGRVESALSRDTCYSGQWANRGARFAWIGEDARLRVTTLDATGAATTHIVGGSDGTVGMSFSPDDGWVLVYTGGGATGPAVSISRLRTGAVEDATPLVEPTPGGPDLRADSALFALDGRSVFFTTTDPAAGPRLHQAALRSTGVGAPRTVATFADPAVSLAYQPGEDGRTLIYSVRDANAVAAYHAIDLVDPQIAPRQLIPYAACTASPQDCSNPWGWQLLP